jgi:hypothetical protein
MNTMTNDVHEISPEALQGLGGGKLAYVKTIRSEDVQKHFPQAPELAAGTLLYALHAADGTPIMLTDSREAAIANAWSNELEAVSREIVHREKDKRQDIGSNPQLSTFRTL